MKSLTIAIDPSSTASGLAIFRGKRLVSVDLVRGKTTKGTNPPDRAVKIARDGIKLQLETLDKAMVLVGPSTSHEMLEDIIETLRELHTRPLRSLHDVQELARSSRSNV